MMTNHYPLDRRTFLVAGGGIRGGQVYGASDRRAEYPADNPVRPEHIARTVFHAMGIDDLTPPTAKVGPSICWKTAVRSPNCFERD
jgi:hypothetical protein